MFFICLRKFISSKRQIKRSTKEAEYEAVSPSHSSMSVEYTERMLELEVVETSKPLVEAAPIENIGTVIANY